MSKRTSDPFDMWRQWMDRAERQMNAALNELMDSDSFSKTQSKAMEAMLKMQAGMNDATQRYFGTINVATRTDVLSIANQLSEIEARLHNIESMISSQVSAEGAAESRPRPRRTKKAAKKKAQSSSAAKKSSRKATSKKAARKKKAAKKKTAKKKSTKTKPARKKATPKAAATRKTRTRKKR